MAATPLAANALVQPKLRIDVLVPDELADPVAEAIATAVNTGSIGDGKIWVAEWTASCGCGPARAMMTPSEAGVPKMQEVRHEPAT